MSKDSIVKFTSDAAVSSATVVRPSQIPHRDFGNLFGDTVQDLQSFLTRPVRFTVGTISGSTNAINNILQTINLDSFFATNTMLAAKHAGFFLGRYSCRVILEVNAERFHQGLVRASWLPVGGVPSAYTARLSHFTTRSTLPHATMNVNCDTALVLDCPWVSPHTHTSIHTTAVGLGSVIIWNQTAIAFGAGSNSIGYTVWLEYYDVDLAVPTSQMSGRPSNRSFTVKRLSPGARESMAVQGRPVSSVLSSVSLASEYLAKIPLLSSVFGTASWVTQILANGAYAFGYSKPGYVQAPTRVAPETIPSMLTVDSVDNSSYFALSQENQLGCTPWAGTDIDEMAVAYVASRPSIYAVYSWDTTQVVDTTITTIACNPAAFFNDLGTVTQVRYLTPISYITRLAMFWRGSIILKFNFGKTEFHSGRLSFEYFKAGLLADQQPRTIVDLREGSEFIITIPYADVKPWSLVDPLTSIAGLRIVVLNPLVAPSTAETSIQFTVEAYAGSDFELAGPVLPEVNLAPTYAAPAMADFPIATPQMEESPEDTPGLCDLAIERVIGPNQNLQYSLNPAQYCMGEVYTSWRQLIKRFAPFLNSAGTTGVTFCPSILHVRSAAATSRTPDYFTLIASCYLGNAGSIRLKTNVTTRVPVTYRSNIIVSLIQSNTVALSASLTGPTIAGSFPMINSQSDRNTIEAATPPYMTGLYRTQHSVGIGLPTVGADNLVYGTGIIIPGTLAATDFSNFTVFRAAGEDFNCGIFIGPPPLSIN